MNEEAYWSAYTDSAATCMHNCHTEYSSYLINYRLDDGYCVCEGVQGQNVEWTMDGSQLQY
jgi:hypothetical protein